MPGDERSHVSNSWSDAPSWERKQNTPGAPYRGYDQFTYNSARNRQKHPTAHLTKDQASSVAQSLVETAHRQGWRILKAAVMGNHVHVLITDCPDDGPAVRRILKGNTQSVLNRLLGRPVKWWTAKGSDRYLHDEPSIAGAAEYVANQQYILAAIDNMKLI